MVVATLKLLLFAVFWVVLAEVGGGTDSGDSEPHLVSYGLLEGVVEPFKDPRRSREGEGAGEPAWRAMKRSADLKAASSLLQQALAEYGQLIRHPYVFSEMPPSQRYDVFISMSKILKTMGYYQKAELLLYESLANAQDPSEAHLQLALLFLDKEDLDRAKVHIKNCLFYKESDVMLLVYLTSILISEGKIQEAKFYSSRVLGLLDSRVRRLSFLLQDPDDIEASLTALTPELVQHQMFLEDIEDLLGKVFHCEYRFVPSASVDLYRLFSSLHGWMSRGEMSGRFYFDLGQALYEGGRPEVGLGMMVRGQLSATEGEGRVSSEVVMMRMGLEFPLIASSLFALVEAYLNVTSHLERTAESYTLMPIENLQDIYWPLPLIQGSGLPVAPALIEVLRRFEPPNISVANNFIAFSGFSSRIPVKSVPPRPHAPQHVLPPTRGTSQTTAKSFGAASSGGAGMGYMSWVYNLLSLDREPPSVGFEDSSDAYASKMLSKPPKIRESNRETDGHLPVVEVGILGGHLNSHPVGHMVLQRLVGITRARFKITLLALPLVNSDVTRRIVGKVTNVVNVPTSDVNAAFALLASLHLDIILYPDWQPFPDQSSIVFQALRIAPVQICFYVRGSSCGTLTMDYYIVPEDTWGYETRDVGTFSSEPYPESSSWTEQLVRLDWPVFTVHAIRETALKAEGSGADSSGDGWEGSGKSDKVAHAGFVPSELEGQIFFDEQPVMLLCGHPTTVHPLMDEAILEILRSVPNLQLLIVVTESFFSHSKNLDSAEETVMSSSPLSRRRMSWGGKLVRRLWNAAGPRLSNRIRLLPEVLSGTRLNQMIKKVDVILDTFPFGLSLDVLSAALYYGTPVVTMRSGARLSTPRDRLKDIRKLVQSRRSRYRGSEMYERLMREDLPWSRCRSPVAAALQVLGFGDKLVANSTHDFVRIASSLLKENGREEVYDIRVRLFETLDKLPVTSPCFSTTTAIPLPPVSTVETDLEPGPCPVVPSSVGRLEQPLNDHFLASQSSLIASHSKPGLFLTDLERYVELVKHDFQYDGVLCSLCDFTDFYTLLDDLGRRGEN